MEFNEEFSSKTCRSINKQILVNGEDGVKPVIIKSLKPKKLQSDHQTYKEDLAKEVAIIEALEKSMSDMQTKGQAMYLEVEKEVQMLEPKAQAVAQQAYKEYIDKRVKEKKEALEKLNMKLEKKQKQIMEANKRKYDLEIIFNYLDKKRVIHG